VKKISKLNSNKKKQGHHQECFQVTDPTQTSDQTDPDDQIATKTVTRIATKMATRILELQHGHRVHLPQEMEPRLGHQAELVLPIPEVVLHPGHQVALDPPILAAVHLLGRQVEPVLQTPEVVLHPGHQVVLDLPILEAGHLLGHQVEPLPEQLFLFLTHMDQIQVATVDMAVVMSTNVLLVLLVQNTGPPVLAVIPSQFA